MTKREVRKLEKVFLNHLAVTAVMFFSLGFIFGLIAYDFSVN